ncbi:MAG: hypothetical protein IPM79_29500 [Polyangiaceae bacterium]|nr:hypothetical protein [Polyangiaceae bacterium]MBK8941629.1 hypothetical protein [Polyangiaceae bacterium]
MPLRSVAALAFTLGLAPWVGGCPANTCFLEICEGANCRCSISSCQDGSSYDTRANRCRCDAGRFEIAGQCLTQREANKYCGPGYGWLASGGRGGCVKLSCRAGDTIDQRTGLCVPNQQVAQQAGVQLGQGQKLGCGPTEVLVVSGGQAACVPAASSCATDEVWSGSACQKTATCPTGQAYDPALGRCVPYASSSGASGVAVDVQQWAVTTYGPPGGMGTPAFCGSLAKKPLSFGVGPGGSALVRVAVGLTFPGAEVARGGAQTSASYEATGAPVPPAAAAEVQASASALLAPLVLGGGRASSEAASTTVRCAIVNGSKPVVVPDEIGGF